MKILSCSQITIALVSLFLLFNGAAISYTNQSMDINSCINCQNLSVTSEKDGLPTMYLRSMSVNRMYRSSNGNLPCCNTPHCQHMTGHCGFCFVAACVDTTTVLIAPSLLFTVNNINNKPLPVYISPPIRPPQLV